MSPTTIHPGRAVVLSAFHRAPLPERRRPLWGRRPAIAKRPAPAPYRRECQRWFLAVFGECRRAAWPGRSRRSSELKRQVGWRRRETGDRRQEDALRRQETGEGRQEDVLWRQEKNRAPGGARRRWLRAAGAWRLQFPRRRDALSFLLSPVSCLLSPVSPLPSPASCLLPPATRYSPASDPCGRCRVRGRGEWLELAS